MASDVLILGGGFAGLAAADALKQLATTKQAAVTLVNRRPYTTMVPALPDLAGTRIPRERLTGDISRLVSADVQLLVQTVQEVDFVRGVVVTDQKTLTYDYLVLALGSVTNLFGFDQHLERVHTLDYLEDGVRIGEEFPEYLGRADTPHAVVVGAGYTGLELACNLRYCAAKADRSCRISIVEVKDMILPGMPDNIRNYMEKRCRERDIETFTGNQVDTFDGANVTLADGMRFEDVFLCWSTGTTFKLEMTGNQEQIKDGRLIVDKMLRLPQHPNVYAAGDAAAMDFGNGYLRKAVNFSIYSGKCAGENISRDIRGREPEAFSPTDLGWVIPFCNTGAGKLFGDRTITGRLPLVGHYLMCGYRNYNLTNRLHFLKLAARACVAKA